MNNLISIVIPIFNGSKMIDRCIRSWENQTNKNFELIFVDDGSEDDSYMRLLNVQKDYSHKLKIKVIQGSHKGVSRARNLGLAQASGEVVGFMDIDDVVHANLIKYLLLAFRDETLDMICIYIKSIKEQEVNTFLEINHKSELIKIIDIDTFIYKLFFDNKILGSACNKYIKKDCLKNKKFLENLSMCEDTEYIYRVVNDRIKKIGILPITLYGYIEHGNNSTMNLNRLFNKSDELKYCESIDTMIRNTRKPKIKKYLCAKKFELLSIACINKQYITKEQLNKMIIESKKCFFSYITCRGYTLSHRIKQCALMLLLYFKK